jgi:hypothetical protein
MVSSGQRVIVVAVRAEELARIVLFRGALILQAFMKASRSALIVSAWVVHMPCG